MNAAIPTADSLICDPLYPTLKQHVVLSTGLAYYEDKDPDLAQRIGRRLATLGTPDCGTYLQLLRDPLRGTAELDALIIEITIGETYFFRHQEHFDALRTVVLPELIARNTQTRRLRIWCAGCADGAEPYSLSILMKNELRSELAGWNVTILGTDINRRCLARAREAVFEDWALRAASDDFKRSCFVRKGKLWSLLPQFREWVSFQYHNLVEDHFPSLVHNLSSFDLIVCRNVMIYFGADVTRRMVGQFHECLSAGGWLLVGPSEPNMTFFTSFRTVNEPGVTLYQKQSVSQPGLPTSMRATITAPLPPASPGSSQILKLASRISQPTLADIQRHADCGAWEAAARCCDQLLERDNLDSEVHFYHALVLEQMNKRMEAEQALQRAIYIDRRAVLPHYYQGLFLQSRGDVRQAARAFENTLDLLSQMPDSVTFPQADGVSVAEMKKLAKMHLETLRDRE